MTSLPLALLFLAVALFSAAELVCSRRSEVDSYIADREAHAVHVLMNGGMAVMFAPFYDAAIGRAIVIGYGVAIAALLLDVVVRRRGERAAGTIYHVISLAAMIWAIRQMSADMAGMGGMAGMAPPNGAFWPSLLLAALFACDGIAAAALVAFAPRTLLRMDAATLGTTARLPETSAIRAIRIAAVPHCVMDAGMVAMLWPLFVPG